MSDEIHCKRSKEMARRYEELAMQPRDLSREERERIPLEEIAKWKQKEQAGAPLFYGHHPGDLCNPQTRSGKRPLRRPIEDKRFSHRR
jgi:hypothetical protein